MDSSNLAICVGPNMLSPETGSTLPLEVQKEMNDKVTVLVEFLINNCSEIFEEDIAFPVCASAEESPEHTDSSTGIVIPGVLGCSSQEDAEIKPRELGVGNPQFSTASRKDAPGIFWEQYRLEKQQHIGVALKYSFVSSTHPGPDTD
ncbi:uncharacterized protein LOC114003975 isoform X1 [Pipra filicauda]|uniref:Uncharacterized protein LOC114003975 isoform X1 n=1 Tax=Pipra filicauda TaxID=649802 RepID=A0A7R5L1L6_9PASS|nr:uncharacterized protein LOC114003975 isoform X1 [Pipra filicauda]XP_039243330.1 uncharacterized protein LOC114003975 isoform X1 [Pipra filicauda]XP_039243331.1 uncharacterized protein LOC114003975 isoform X1 [Pipra filicauda]XP_039243332.1 uncharacterized protein LOC114003975 isoform X1 [Pipra filicauda]